MMITAYLNASIRAISREKMIKGIITFQTGILSFLFIVIFLLLIAMNGTKNKALFQENLEETHIPADLIISKNLQEFKMIFFGGAYISSRKTYSDISTQLNEKNGRHTDPEKSIIHLNSNIH